MWNVSPFATVEQKGLDMWPIFCTYTFIKLGKQHKIMKIVRKAVKMYTQNMTSMYKP